MMGGSGIDAGSLASERVFEVVRQTAASHHISGRMVFEGPL
jgi:hypothetical protein